MKLLRRRSNYTHNVLALKHYLWVWYYGGKERRLFPYTKQAGGFLMKTQNFLCEMKSVVIRYVDEYHALKC